MSTIRFIIACATAVLLGACAAQQAPSSIMSTQGSTITRTGTVTEVRDVTLRSGNSSGIGSAIGAIVGGVAGSTIGRGNGSTAAGIGGAVAGGIAGQRASQAVSTSAITQLTVKMENGEVHTYNVESGENFRTGDKVTVTTSHLGTRITR